VASWRWRRRAAQPSLTPEDDELDLKPVHGYTRSGYVIFYKGLFYGDLGDVTKAHQFMVNKRELWGDG
jgi:hypothetical protein